jgi:2-isopropylmalate synthase
MEHHLIEQGARQAVRLILNVDGHTVELEGVGNGPLDAAMHALDLPVTLQSYEERAIGSGAAARAVAYIELSTERFVGSRFGVAIQSNIITASIVALFCGVNRVLRAMEEEQRRSSLLHLRQRHQLTTPQLRSA